MQIFALAYLTAGLFAGVTIHPAVGIAVLATPVAVSKLV